MDVATAHVLAPAASALVVFERCWSDEQPIDRRLHVAGAEVEVAGGVDPAWGIARRGAVRSSTVHAPQHRRGGTNGGVRSRGRRSYDVDAGVGGTPGTVAAGQRAHPRGAVRTAATGISGGV